MYSNFDECKLFTELGYDVFSNGAYRYPEGAHTLPRPGIPGMKRYDDLAEMAAAHPKTAMPDAMIAPFDVVVVMHSPEVLIQNWPTFKRLNKRVIWRTIGQSLPGLEKKIQPLVADGLEIVRYSPKERNMTNYAGETAIIRFYKDPAEYTDWTGDKVEAVNFTQSLKGRRDFCHYDEIMATMQGFRGAVYGVGNDDLGDMNGGELPYDLQIKKMQEARVMVYGGTWPASYTLTIMEAMMTGLPVVAIGKGLAMRGMGDEFDFYEVHEWIESGVNGFCHDDVASMRNAVDALLRDHDLAREISKNARKTAIELFGKQTIADQWRKLLG